MTVGILVGGIAIGLALGAAAMYLIQEYLLRRVASPGEVAALQEEVARLKAEVKAHRKEAGERQGD